MPPSEDDEGEPWTTPPSGQSGRSKVVGPLPQRLDLTLGDQIYVPKEGLPPGLRNRLLRLAAFQNPEFYKAQAMRLSTHGKPRIIACAEEFDQHIGLPRGCWEEFQALLADLQIDVDVY